MKTIFKKIKSIALLLFAGLILGANLNVAAVDKTITVGSPTKLDSYISGTSFNYKVTKEGKALYCINRWKNVVKNTTGTLVGEKDAGYAYIVANGYPYKKITGDKYKDYYITQSAIWWYIDDLNGNNYSLSKEFKTTASDKYGLRSHIKTLVAGAKKARNAGYQAASLSLSVSDKNLHMKDANYFVSEYVTVNTDGIKTYEVALTAAPQGTIIIDANGNKKTKFNAGEKFAVKVPESKITELTTNITLKVSATGQVNKVYEYKPADSSMQNFVTGFLIPEAKTITKELKLCISTSKVAIVKLDKANNKALAGAVLVLKNADGKEISRWTTTTKAQSFKNLSNGSYSVEEISAPAGYVKTTEKVKFKITNSNRDVKVVVYNEAKKEEPKPVTGIAKIKKVDKATNKALAGAVLVVKDAKGNVIDTFTSTTGYYEIKDLAIGEYTVQEKSAPKGYIKSKDVVRFSITKTNTTAIVTFYNEAEPEPEKPKPETGTVKIKKVDKATKETVKGAILVVKDSKGTVIDTFVTTDSYYEIKDLDLGTYTVEEESAPAGYIKSDEKIEFEITKANKNVTVTFYNEAEPEPEEPQPVKGTVKITKIDKSTDSVLPGAVLVIKDTTGTVVDRFTTTSKAYTTVLPEGSYTVEEESAPAGYKKSDDVIEFTIDSENLTHEIIFENYPEVIVPNTATSSFLTTIIGIIMIGSAALFVSKNAKKA